MSYNISVNISGYTNYTVHLLKWKYPMHMIYKNYLEKSSYLFVYKNCVWTETVYYKPSSEGLWMCSGGLTKGSKMYSAVNFFIIDIPANKRQIYNRINILNWFVQFNNSFCDVCTVIRIKKSTRWYFLMK